MPGEAVSTQAPPRRWRIGDVTVTKILESEVVIDLPMLFPQAGLEEILALPWLQPHFITPEGRGRISTHALVVDTPSQRIIVDTCVGNGRDRGGWAHFANLQTSFLQDLEAAGFAPASFDIVLCTHLHTDHVGWNTMRVGGQWVPTFPNARYLFNRTEYDHWVGPMPPQPDGFDQVQRLTFADSIQPVLAAGLAEFVESTHRLCDEVTLVPTAGHTPGHVSVRISSRGEEALITGDISHHPCQLAHPEWRLASGDTDPEQAISTRQQVFSAAADRPVLVIGTHWSGATAGKIHRSGKTFCLAC